MDLRYIIASVLVSVPALLSAQTSVSFDVEDFTGIGVYDSWEESPFRTGVLAGNAAVTANFLLDEINHHFCEHNEIQVLNLFNSQV